MITTLTRDNTIFVTEIMQFALPASIHIDTLRESVRFDPNTSIYSLTVRDKVFSGKYATYDQASDSLLNETINWLKQYGVRIDGGTFYADDWVDAAKHKPLSCTHVLLRVVPASDDPVYYCVGYWNHKNGFWYDHNRFRLGTVEAWKCF